MKARVRMIMQLYHRYTKYTNQKTTSTPMASHMRNGEGRSSDLRPQTHTSPLKAFERRSLLVASSCNAIEKGICAS